jgi:hypothetical protein
MPPSSATATEDDDDDVGDDDDDDDQDGGRAMPSSPPRKVVDIFLASCLSAYALGLAIFLVDQIVTCCLSRGSACTSGLLGTIVLSYSLAGLSRRCLLHLLTYSR